MKIALIRHRVAVGLIILATLLSGYYSLFVNPSIELIRNDGAEKWEERMQAVRKALPSSVRDVGYISDPELTAQVQEYFLTRYALAPVVVRLGVNHEWIIGNFTQPGFEDLIKNQIPSEYTIKKLGAGIYLIHRKLQ
jgi:hypothetical protein